mgnify:CR=1 FL=1
MEYPAPFRDDDNPAIQMVARPRASDPVGESLREAFRVVGRDDAMRDLLMQLERIA